MTTLRLPNAPPAHSQTDQNQMRRSLETHAATTDASIATLAKRSASVFQSIPASALLNGSSTATQSGAAIRIPASTLTGNTKLRVTGWWEFVNAQASAAPQVVVSFRLGSVAVLTYTTAAIIVGSVPQSVSFVWDIMPYQQSSLSQAHQLLLLDAVAKNWTSLPVDLFSSAPTIRSGVARSAVNLTAETTLSVAVAFPAGQTSAVTGQLAAGTIEVVPS